MYHYPSPLHMVQVQMDVSNDECGGGRSDGHAASDIKPAQPQHLSRAFSILSSNSIMAPSASSRNRSMKQQKRRTKMNPRKVTAVSEDSRPEHVQEERSSDDQEEEDGVRYDIISPHQSAREPSDKNGEGSPSLACANEDYGRASPAGPCNREHRDPREITSTFRSEGLLHEQPNADSVWSPYGSNGNPRQRDAQVPQYNPMLPYMGQMTLDNMKPRRGRKPKKTDICHLITKNYSADGLALKRHPAVNDGSRRTSRSTPQMTPQPRGLPPLRPIFPAKLSPDSEGPASAEDLDVDDPRRYQLIFPEVADARAEMRSATNTDECRIGQPGEMEDQQETPLLLQALKNPASLERGNKRQTRNAPAPAQITSLMREQASRGTNKHKKQAEVSICKFKFTAGPCPTLEKKKMLSVDAGGKFHMYTVASGTGNQQSAGQDFVRMENCDSNRMTHDRSGAISRQDRSTYASDFAAMRMPVEVEMKDDDHEMPAEEPSQQDSSAITDSSGRRIETRSRTGTTHKVNYNNPQNLKFACHSTDEKPASATIPSRRRTGLRRKMEETFKDKGFLIQTQKYDAPQGATFCKFRQLKKFTRYLFRNWKDHLPAEAAVASGSQGPS